MPLLAAAAFAIALRWSDLPPGFAPGDEAGFPALLERLDSATTRRLEEGEWDHLVFYVLQGTAFTQLTVIEPAASARDFVESGRIPPLVEQRLDHLLASTSAESPRLAWARRKAATVSRDVVLEHYGRAMRFLYDKEWSPRNMSASARRAHVARLYQSRGHSSDTSADSTKALDAGLAALRRLDPQAPLRDILVIGPGSSFAPRTGLREDGPPRSYQMEHLARLLPAARLECIDVNPRVVEAARCAERVNILTARRDSLYDLIVITNVLVYLNDTELPLALANIAAMLKPGGFLLHNDMRDEVAPLGRALAMPVVNARAIRLGSNDNRALFDAAILHRR